jgi:hypothetical protein
MSPESASVLHRFVSLAKEPDYLALSCKALLRMAHRASCSL